MRIFGWVLGGLFLVDGVLALAAKRDVMKVVNVAIGRKLPHPVSKTLRKVTDVNDTALRAMGINNVLAGAGMLVLSTLVGGRSPLLKKA